MKFSIYLTVVLATLIGAIGCKHPTEPSVAAATVSFSYQILPIIESNCGLRTCHDAKTHEHNLVLSSYSAIRELVVPRDTIASSLYLRSTATLSGARMPPSPRPKLTPLQLELIKNWIMQGAENTPDTASLCDTLSLTYAKNIFPIFEVHCLGCHNSFDKGGFFDVTNFDHIKGYAEDGTLRGVIEHGAAYEAMPRNADTLGPMITRCDQLKIEKWIRDGIQHN
ncbi:MAG: hypothetical protein WCH46_06240 [bacterium]